ncbi:MAG: lipoprotein [Nitrospirota bacterium]|nr:lipoprotein [Nitrospirota bacterium]
MIRPVALGLLMIWLVGIALLTGCGHRGPLTPPGERPQTGEWRGG